MTTDDRCHQYAITAFKLSSGLPLAPSAEAADDDREWIAQLAAAVIITRELEAAAGGAL